MGSASSGLIAQPQTDPAKRKLICITVKFGFNLYCFKRLSVIENVKMMIMRQRWFDKKSGGMYTWIRLRLGIIWLPWQVFTSTSVNLLPNLYPASESQKNFVSLRHRLARVLEVITALAYPDINLSKQRDRSPAERESSLPVAWESPSFDVERPKVIFSIQASNLDYFEKAFK